jgi:hypothetical protein
MNRKFNPIHPMKTVRQLSRNALVFALWALSAAAVLGVDKEPYVWKQVVLGGGGNVPGLAIHPKVADLVYIRTDVGGAYRWEKKKEEWIPLTDWIPDKDWNLYGADSIAVDPGEASGNTVYLLTGKYESKNGSLFKSSDRGATWTLTTLPVSGSSNTDQPYGERIAVDPRLGKHVLCASRSKGLWRSLDAGESWEEVASAPKGLLPGKDRPELKGVAGLVFVLFDAGSPAASNGRTSVIYLGASGEGVYQSNDGGGTWKLLEGSPLKPRRAAVGSDHSLVVSHESGLARFANATWTSITPPDLKSSCQAIAIDPKNPKHLLTASGEGKHGLAVYRSTDAGANWEKVNSARNQTVPWWPDWHWLSSIGSLTFDPHHPNRVWATDWYGIYRAPDITAKEVVWTNYESGHEEIVTTGAMTTLPQGDIKLLSGIADVGGFNHRSLTERPPHNIWKEGLPNGLTTTGVAFQASNPLFVVRVGARDWSSPGTGGYSMDGGQTWTVFPSLPYKNIRGGRVAIAATGTRILWAPQQGEPYYTDDFGASWMPCQSEGALKYTVRGLDIFQWHQPLAADGVNPKRFYIFKSGKFWRSDDGGDKWQVVSSLPDEGTHMIYTVPGKENHVWIGMNFHGLRFSDDGGATWKRNPLVSRAGMFAFGKNRDGSGYPSIYLSGAVDKVEGLYRSDDQGESWVRIDSEQNQVGDQRNIMAGDWQVYGRVFIGTNGRGIFYGEPEK